MSGLNVDLKLNHNRHVMLNILDKQEERVRLSIHHMFLEAPKEVRKGIANYICNNDVCPKITHFIRKHSSSIKRRVAKSGSSEGKVYNLQKIYDEINAIYFESSVDLPIYWYGNKNRLPKTKIIFGQYLADIQSIRIHSLLDQEEIPESFLGYVVYHEMLHHVCPPLMKENGNRSVHHSEFKRREKLYHDYDKANDWIKSYPDVIFSK